MKNMTLFAGATGLNTVNDPMRIPYDSGSGISDLAVAVNVTISDTGFIGRRDGYKLIRSGAAHSLFCDGYDCLFVSGSSLFRLLPDYSAVVVKDLAYDGRMGFAQVNNDIYFSNTVDLGIIREGGVYENWVARPYVGPRTNRVFDGPRPGKHLAFFAARILVSQGNILWYSEPFGWAWFDRTRNFVPFPQEIVMVKPVAGGVFVSDLEKTYFLQGNDPKEWQLIIAARYPALEWSDAIDYVEAQELGYEDLSGAFALWASNKGACLGTPQGQVINLNRDKVVYPSQPTWGASLLRGYHMIHAMGV